MAEWTDSEDLSWDGDNDDDDAAAEPATVLGAPRGPVDVFCRASGSSEAEPSSDDLITHFVLMGFCTEMVVKAINENEEGDKESILETLLTYAAIEKSPSVNSCESDDDLSNFDGFEDGAQDFIGDFSERDRKLLTLLEMDFPIAEATAAIKRCGVDSTILELADSIQAAQMAEETECYVPLSNASSSEESRMGHIIESHIGQKRMRSEEYRKHNRNHLQSERKGRRVPPDEDAPVMCQIPKPMIGFGLPYQPMRITHRSIPDPAKGPPYFYYENVALTPKGVWDSMSRFLHGIEPEFVDSRYFCAAARKRGYIHNLPIVGRFPLLPVPPKTIHEALPITKKWWPSWDTRTHLNCLQTTIASAKLAEKIRGYLADFQDTPPRGIQKFILEQCKKWNLVWVGLHKVAPLEADEIEMLLGFPKNHTRGGGISRTDRYKSLGNSFQVDTVAFHLSVLKSMYPDGMNVLSLFSGIGGAEVALHRLGIRMKVVVSIEISEINRNIVRSWWEQSDQMGTLIHIADVKAVNDTSLKQMVDDYGGFDLVIGGSPCNNLAGSNRYTRCGLQGEHSSLFYDYYRILDSVKLFMGQSW